MNWLAGSAADVGQAVAKAGLMYATAVVGFRLAERRTIAQWSAIDFATAVAVGALIGRTSVAAGQAFVTGAAALSTLLVLHQVLSRLRLHAPVARLTDHRVCVLVEHGRLHCGQLRRCGLTEADLFAQLRSRGVLDLHGLAYVLFEAGGTLTVVPEGPVPPLVQAALSGARTPPDPAD